jgi:hypothetical protein
MSEHLPCKEHSSAPQRAIAGAKYAETRDEREQRPLRTCVSLQCCYSCSGAHTEKPEQSIGLSIGHYPRLPAICRAACSFHLAEVDPGCPYVPMGRATRRMGWIRIRGSRESR